MARARLTDKFVLSLKAPATGRQEVFDSVKTGLSIRVTQKGVKTWSIMYRMDGEQRRDTLGQYPRVPLAKAREFAGDTLELAAKGQDPRRLAAVKKDDAQTEAANTIEAIVEKFIERHAAKKRWGELERILNRDIVPAWSARPVTDIARRDVRDLLEKIEKRAPIQANRTLTVLRIFFRWAAKNDYVTADPTVGIDKTPEKPRDRNLTDDEVRAFWKGCETLGKPFGPLLQLLLLTGVRKSEFAKAHWHEIDEANRLLLIPAERMKNNQAHTVPLSNQAWEKVEQLDKIGETPDFIFTTNGRTPVSGFSKAKAELDRYMLDELRRDRPEPEKITLEPWRIHDLRRVVRSRLSKLGVQSDIAERVLAHSIGGIRRVYDAYDFLDEKREALDRWAVHLQGIVTLQHGNVIKIRKVKSEQSNLG